MGPVLPADNKVHWEWSYVTSPEASMVRSCEHAVALGLPSVAFTEHLEFTSGGAGDAISGIAAYARWWNRIRPLDVTGYRAAIEEGRERFPSVRVLAGGQAGG